MDVLLKLNQYESMKLRLENNDIEDLRHRIADGIVNEWLDKNFSDFGDIIVSKIANRLSNDLYERIISDFNNQTNKIFNAFVSGRAIPVDFRIEKVNVTQKIDAEEYIKNKYWKSNFICRKRSELVYGKTPHEALNHIINEHPSDGFPDFVVYDKTSFMFVEVKTNGDSLRESQMKWINNHPNVKIVIYYIDQIMPEA